MGFLIGFVVSIGVTALLLFGSAWNDIANSGKK
jgi:hypothetical protein